MTMLELLVTFLVLPLSHCVLVCEGSTMVGLHLMLLLLLSLGSLISVPAMKFLLYKIENVGAKEPELLNK